MQHAADHEVITLQAQSPAEAQMLAEMGRWKPVAITLDAQEFGALYATKTSPNGFIQYLLAKLKTTGAVPVEGVLALRLAHGKLFKLKDSPLGKGYFSYIWLPENYWQTIQAMGGVN
jgi:hypothetical protein